MKTIVTLLTIVSIQAQAIPYDQFYTSANGSKIEASQAMLMSTKGETVYRCQTVEAKVSKSGTSFGMHNVKKPKAAKGE